MIHRHRTTGWSRQAAGIVTVLVVLWAAHDAAGLTVQDARWGFNGQVVPARINILTVQLRNESDAPFDGELILRRTEGIGPVGAPDVQTAFITPGGTRRVQFFTYHSQPDEKWVLSWGSGADQRLNLNSPDLGAPATVFFQDPDDVYSRPKLKTFPEEDFPATVSATDGLYCAVLDHVPEQDQARRQAFMDWLRRGGVLAILTDAGGAWPRFPADMGELNTERESFQVGAGRVLKLRASRADADLPAVLAGQGIVPLEFAESRGWRGAENPVFMRLRELADPPHAWGLIYLVAIVYMVLLGPVSFLLSRRWRDRHWPLLFFLGTVLVFSLILERIGRRGYGESAAVHVLAYARPIQADSYDVTQWANAFVTRGGWYTVQHLSAHNLYAFGEEMEAVNGELRNGLDGSFRVDMPLYSSRSFVHRGFLKGPDLSVSLISLGGDEELDDLVFSCGPDFPKEVLDVSAVYDGKLYRLGLRGDRLELRSGTPRDLDDFLLPDNSGSWRGPTYVRRGSGEEEATDRDGVYRDMVPAAIAYGLGATPGRSYRLTRDLGPPDCVQLFVTAPCPESFAMRGRPMGSQEGYVVYHLCVPLSSR